jgi:hypothetical protein
MTCPQPQCGGRLEVKSTRHRPGRTERSHVCDRCGHRDTTVQIFKRVWAELVDAERRSRLEVDRLLRTTHTSRRVLLKPGESLAIIAAVR